MLSRDDYDQFVQQLTPQDLLSWVKLHPDIECRPCHALHCLVFYWLSDLWEDTSIAVTPQYIQFYNPTFKVPMPMWLENTIHLLDSTFELEQVFTVADALITLEQGLLQEKFYQ